MSEWLLLSFSLAGIVLVALFAIRGRKLGVSHLSGWPSATNASAIPKAESAPKLKRGRQRRRGPRLLSRVTGPRAALRLIADMEGQISSVRREPDARDLGVAWRFLGHPAGDFVKALIALKESVPLFHPEDDEEAELDELTTKAKKSPKKFVAAIWRGVPLCASREATNLLARVVRRQFKGTIPKSECMDDRQWHVVDQYDRPLICRLEEDDKGQLEILDGQGGWLHRETITLSHWKPEKGWLGPGGLRRRQYDGDGGGLPDPQPEPNLSKPKI